MSQRHSIGTETGAAVVEFTEISQDAEEAALLAAARMGNSTAFVDLVGRHAGRIRRIAFRITRNREDAEDAIQECFKSAFTHLKSFRGRSRFSTWLTRIATNCALMKIRTRREMISLDDSVETLVSANYQHALRLSPTPEEHYSRRELRSILAQEVARLKPNLQKAVRLYLMDELVARDAAKLLGISNSALKARVHRARLALCSRLSRRVGRRPTPNNQDIGSEVLDGGAGSFMLCGHSSQP